MKRNSYRYKDADLTGLRRGKLVVVRKANFGRSQWVCKCDCGNEVTLPAYRIMEYISCGCVGRENAMHLDKHTRTHGMTNTRLYHTYCKMKERCYNPKIEHYPEYGGRGIKMCDEWRNSFESFRDWAYSAGYDPTKDRKEQSLDRIDVNGNYEPDNCRWITQKEQTRNTRRTIYIYDNGVKKPFIQFCEENGIKDYKKASRWLQNGKSLQEIKESFLLLENIPDGYVTLKEAAKHYGVCEETIYNWSRNGKLHRLKISNKIYVSIGNERVY